MKIKTRRLWKRRQIREGEEGERGEGSIEVVTESLDKRKLKMERRRKKSEKKYNKRKIRRRN